LWETQNEAWANGEQRVKGFFGGGENSFVPIQEKKNRQGDPVGGFDLVERKFLTGMNP